MKGLAPAARLETASLREAHKLMEFLLERARRLVARLETASLYGVHKLMEFLLERAWRLAARLEAASLHGVHKPMDFVFERAWRLRRGLERQACTECTSLWISCVKGLAPAARLETASLYGVHKPMEFLLERAWRLAARLEAASLHGVHKPMDFVFERAWRLRRGLKQQACTERTSLYLYRYKGEIT